MAIGKGFEATCGFKKNPNTWGSGLAVACGSGDGLEFNSEGLTADSQLIENMQVSGSAQQLPGPKGNEFHAGPLNCDAYYQGLDVPMAMVLGSVLAGPTQQGGTTAYKTVTGVADNHEGIFGTLVFDKTVAVHEYPFVKVGGFTLEWEQGQQGKVTFDMVPFGVNLNIGAVSAAGLVAPVEPANGALTIVGQPAEPTQITVLVVDANTSITELVVTVVGTDRDDNAQTWIYRLTTHGLSETSTEVFKTISSVTASELAGTATGDTVQLGYLNGINSQAQVANITLPSTRDFVLFSQMAFLANDQGGAALTSANEYFLSAFRLQVDLQMARDDVTTRFGNRIDEPVKDGFVLVTGGVRFSKYETANHPLYKQQLGKQKQKATVTFTGPVADGAFFYSWTFFLNNLQFRTGSPNVGGPQRIPMDMEFKAHRALAAPSGFSTYTGAITQEVVNKRSTSPLA